MHTDLCYMKDKTPGRALYFATFIADFSRKLWCSALKTKYQVIEIFKIFHVSVERETGRKLNCIWADNGGEYRWEYTENWEIERKTTPKWTKVAALKNIIHIWERKKRCERERPSWSFGRKQRNRVSERVDERGRLRARSDCRCEEGDHVRCCSYNHRVNGNSFVCLYQVHSFRVFFCFLFLCCSFNLVGWKL